MAKEKAATPELFVREARVFKGRAMSVGEKFDPAAVGCSPAEAEIWLGQGLLMTGETMAKLVTDTAATPGGGENLPNPLDVPK